MMEKIRWEIITVGHLSRNRFWDEDEGQPYREVLCTSTLIRTGTHNIVVDPSQPPEVFAQSLFDASGLKPNDIDLVYLTHKHPDHYVGLALFEGVQVYMAAGDLESVLASGDETLRARLAPVRAAEGALCPGVDIVPLPGHTAGLAGLLFCGGEGQVLICGDAVMTRDFFAARLPYYFGEDIGQNHATIERMAGMADIIVPGHGNYFVAEAYTAPKSDK